MRRELLKTEIDVNIVHKLLTRSIFIKYLEDRTDTNGNNVFPKGFFNTYYHDADCFTDILVDKNATYCFFRDLDNKFNGDILCISETEDQIIQNEHLRLLRRLLIGDAYLNRGQMALWPLYSFNIIPIELISNIYQEFFHHEVGENAMDVKGTHYTPYHLVSFLMDEVLPWDGKSSLITILDPACGSGIFLVEAYRRLINHWKQANQNSDITISILSDILKNNIFGIDCNENAIGIAALSLYLTMCDYLEPKTIWDELRFETLNNRNLFVSDFFNNEQYHISNDFDIIIGNPPWQSKLSSDAEKYLKSSGEIVGDKQICQAFMWKVGNYVKENGQICLLVSSKALLFNRSLKNTSFRNNFFSSFNIRTIINFSALRHTLFSKAIGPGAAIIYSKGELDKTPIFYCSPKPSHSPQDNWRVIIEPNDIFQIPKEDVINNDIIWKVAMWGGPRDYQLIKKLSTCTLKHICYTRGWIHGEGFIIGKADKFEPELHKKPYVDVRKIRRLVMNEDQLPTLNQQYFYRSAKNNREIFKGPHLLIKQTPSKDIGLVSTVLKNDAVFRHSLLGIHSDEKDIGLLGSVCLVINSIIAQYFQMLTSRKWLVERDEFEKEEIMNLPMPLNILSKEYNYEDLVSISKLPNWEERVEKLIISWFDLNRDELALIYDAIENTLDFFRKGRKSQSLKKVDKDHLVSYLFTLCKSLNRSLPKGKKKFVGSIYFGQTCLQLVSVELMDEFNDYIKEIHTEQELNLLLKELDEVLLTEESTSIYFRRHLKRYSGRKIYIVKPNEKRYWSTSMALHDADNTISELLNTWKEIR